MRQLLIVLFVGLLFSLDVPAQGYLNTLDKVVNGINQLGQQNRQRNNQRYNNRGTYQNNQRNDKQETLYQQRRETQQRNYIQQKTAERVESSNDVSSSNINKEAQGDNNVVTLVTSGTGNTKEEATLNALRSAIEQAFGTFVSANTEVLNDELIKDEIATVSTGNISQYNILSTTRNENGLYDVSVQAVVSIGNLTNYAKSKGFQVELAGAEFVMNMKMRELNKKNELAAIDHMVKKLKSIASNGGLFNYELEKSEPVLVDNSKYGVKLKLLFYGNDNTKAFYDEIYNTIGALSLSKQEVGKYKEIGLKYYVYDEQLIKTIDFLAYRKKKVYYLRNDYNDVYSYGSEESSWLMPYLIENALEFVVYDNLGNKLLVKTDNEINRNTVWLYCNENRGNVIKAFHLSPSNRVAGVKGRVIHSVDTPLIDYMMKDDSWWIQDSGLKFLNFNPLLDYETSRRITLDNILERNRSNCYFQLEFFVLYSEEELSNLKSIAVKNRESNVVLTGETIGNKEDAKQQNDLPRTDVGDSSANQTNRSAEFPRGSGAMMQYISRSIKYPAIAEENGIQGDVIVQFDVEKDGSLTNIQIAKSIDPSLDKEALRVVKNMPKWIPATKDGVAVSSQNTISIPFRL